MNRFRSLTVAGVLGVALASGAAFAQAAQNPPAQTQDGDRRGGPGGPGGRGGRLGGGPGGELRGLDLTEAQRNQIQAIREQYMAQIRPLQERMQADVRAVLTPEQQATVQEREQRAAARRQQLEQRRQQNQQ